MAFDPNTLFPGAAGDRQGEIIKIRPENLWQDWAGTEPADTDGDPVRRIDGDSVNGHFWTTVSQSQNNLVYRTNGTIHWLEHGGSSAAGLVSNAVWSFMAGQPYLVGAAVSWATPFAGDQYFFGTIPADNTSNSSDPGRLHSVVHLGARDGDEATIAHWFDDHNFPHTFTANVPERHICEYTDPGSSYTVDGTQIDTNATTPADLNEIAEATIFYREPVGSTDLAMEGNLYGMIIVIGTTTAQEKADIDEWLQEQIEGPSADITLTGNNVTQTAASSTGAVEVGSQTEFEVMKAAAADVGDNAAIYVFRPTVDGVTALYQDSAGTTPADAVGDPIKYVVDLSGNGHHAIQDDANPAGLTLRQDASGWYAEADATQNRPTIPAGVVTANTSSMVWEYTETGADNSVLLGATGDSGSVFFASLDGSTNSTINANVTYTDIRGDGTSLTLPTIRDETWDIVTLHQTLSFLGVSFSGTFVTNTIELLGYNTTGWEAEGNLRFLVLTDKALTGTDLTTVEDYIERSDGSYPNETYDLFVVAGQSNAEGRGDSSLSPTVTPGTAYEFTGITLAELSDPVGGAETGSAWPAFVDGYYAATGRIPVITEVAVSGSAQHSIADFGPGHWEANGPLVTDLISRVNDMTTFMTNNGLTYNWKGILWSQGERDAQQISTNASYDMSMYEAAFSAMLADIRADLGAGTELWWSRTGERGDVDSGYDDAYQDIRDSQDGLAASESGVHMAFTGAYGFRDRGLMSDQYHYTQAGYNEMGEALQASVIGQSEIDLTGNSVTAGATSSTGVIEQTHELAANSVTQSSASATGAVVQEHALTGSSVTQSAATTTGAVTQDHALAGSSATQGATSSTGAVGQTHELAGNSVTQATASGTGSISEEATLNGNDVTQGAVSGVGAITQDHELAGESVTQTATSSVGSIASELNLAGASVTQGTASSTGAIEQEHSLTGAPTTQTNSVSTGSITGEAQLSGDNVVQQIVVSAGFITQVHELSGVGVSSANTSSTGAVTEDRQYTGANVTQAAISSVGSIGQAHNLAVSASLFGLVSSTGTITQVHFLSGNAVTQAALSSTGGVIMLDNPPSVTHSVKFANRQHVYRR